MRLLSIIQATFVYPGFLRLCLGHNHFYPRADHEQTLISEPTATNGIPFSTRVYWMRQANLALGHPCPKAPFGTVIVNHTANSGLGELVCTGANSRSATGNPTLHGEIAAINNCTQILTDPSGPYKLSPKEALAAFADLSLYTNAESCPMCASAVRFAGFKEYVYGTSIDTLVERGWDQIQIPSAEVFRRSSGLPSSSTLIADVLTNETDPLFAWQNDPQYPCPRGCSRVGGRCEADAAKQSAIVVRFHRGSILAVVGGSGYLA
ncbi:cytidine deaminase-like protein [Daldinia loculata]|uniref:cytidine deaminase-like protein n=1 Tax=Daldinia loculata TaxID=103429 RepID=UPI0020C4A80D|nr:cytidine deaminase-like protein [Daldinia loculata]KAI1649508.1 cytidine deaminase-like protein [Daldinia loculata]